MLGRVVAGRYRLEARAGEGGMGVVYRARQLAVDREVAIKILHGNLVHDRTARKRFVREAKAVRAVDHRNVIKMYDVEDGKTNPFLHVSMHLSVSEQCSIDQPRGIRQAVELLAARRQSLHDAHHEAMEALGLMIWESQRNGRPPDGQAYIEAVQRCATRD